MAIVKMASEEYVDGKVGGKYTKPESGIPASDLSAAVQTSLGKADTALQEHQSLAAYVNGGSYDSNAKKILLKHDSTTVAEIDATAFIKDGMVSNVEISDGKLVIIFNTDAGLEPIEIPLTDIFNPENYYNKTAADSKFLTKAERRMALGPTASASKDRSFVWDGTGAAYDSQAAGTFNINPSGGNYHPAYGAYIGEQRLPSVIADLLWNTSYAPFPQFDPTATYAVGDIVTRNGYLYEFKAAHEPGEWTGDDTIWFKPNRIINLIYAQLCAKDDPRLSDARTPTAHKSSHATGGSDAIAPSDIGAAASSHTHAASDITSGLATVATTGSYDDLSGKPTIPAAQVNADWNAASGVAQILNKPTIPTVPTNVSAFANDAGYVTAAALRYAMPASVALVAENDAATLVCVDRAVTNATIASGFSTLNLTFPAEVSGYVRDFYLRITVAAGESAPAISVPQGVTIENAGGAVPEIADGEASAAATTLVWFSETAPGIFTAKSETVKAVV